MLHKVAILVAAAEPTPWDSMDGVISVVCQTPDIKPLLEGTTADEMTDAQQARHPLGRIPESLGKPSAEGPEGTIQVACDDLGCIHAVHTTVSPDETFVPNDETEWQQLSRGTWIDVGPCFLRVEPVYEPADTWEASVLSRLSPWRRFVNWLLRRTCKKCFFFDAVSATQWRTKVTHAFGGVSNGPDVAMYESMNDDITKMSADNYRLPDFQNGEFGYCPKRDCGLSGQLPACAEFRRKRRA